MVYFIVFSCRIYNCNLFWRPQSHQCLRTTVKCFTSLNKVYYYYYYYYCCYCYCYYHLLLLLLLLLLLCLLSYWSKESLSFLLGKMSLASRPIDFRLLNWVLGKTFQTMTKILFFVKIKLTIQFLHPLRSKQKHRLKCWRTKSTCKSSRLTDVINFFNPSTAKCGQRQSSTKFPHFIF